LGLIGGRNLGTHGKRNLTLRSRLRNLRVYDGRVAPPARSAFEFIRVATRKIRDAQLHSIGTRSCAIRRCSFKECEQVPYPRNPWLRASGGAEKEPSRH